MNRLATPRMALFVSFLILIVVTLTVGRRLAVQSDSSLSCLIEDNRSGGGSGIHTWAERLGYKTIPLRSPVWEAESVLPPSGNCLITAGDNSWSPFQDPFTDDNWFAISRWVQKGNTLIVITSAPSSIPTSIQEHFTSAVLTNNQNEKVHPSFETRERKFWPTRPLDMALAPTRWQGQMSVIADGPRLIQTPPEMLFVGHQQTAVLAGRELGQGMIYLLLDDSAWTNRGFDQADNAATLARILKQHLSPNGILAFDEYRHGYGRIESFTTFFLSLPGARDFTWMAIAWGLFWLWTRTRRLGPPDEYRDVERRTAWEYIESVAAINQRARAAPLVVAAVLERSRSLFQKRGTTDHRADALFDRAAQSVAAAARPATPKQEMAIVSEMIQLRKDLYGTRPDSRAD